MHHWVEWRGTHLNHGVMVGLFLFCISGLPVGKVVPN